MIRNYNDYEAFSFYQDFDELMDFVNSNWDRVPNSYRSKDLSYFKNPPKDFVGSNDVNLLNSKITEFIDPKSLDKIIAEIKELFSTINLGGAFDKDRMVATDLPIGVFDFSLASAGLFRPQEYYCKELDMIINPDFVRKISDNPSIYVYTDNSSGVSISYTLVQQQEGTYEVQKAEKYKQSLINEGKSDESATKLMREKYPDAKLIFRTKTRKTNLIRRSKLLKENEAGNEKYVDLFINIGGLSSQTPVSLMYAAMPCLLVSFFLDRAGIKTRILGLSQGSKNNISTAIEREVYRFMSSFIIKDYDDTFDFNQTAILTADSRIFRYKMFKFVSVEYFNKFKVDVGSGLGGRLQSTAFDLAFERYKNFYIKNNDGVGVKNKNTRLMFSSSYIPNPDSKEKTMLDGAVNEFFRIIDAIDIEFNGANVALPRIKKREIAREIDISSLRLRLISTVKLATQYDDSDSVYATSPNDIKKREQLEKRLVDDINTNFKNI